MLNKAKQKMLEGRPAVGAEVNLGSTLSVEIIAPLGFDFVLVDNQHGNWADQTSMLAFRNIVLGGSVPMARVRKNDFGLIGRLLDNGSLGVVVPMVNNAEEAEQAVYATRYPPQGGRSSGAFGVGIHGPGYDEWAGEEIFLAVQIETAEGARNTKEIMSVEGIDGCWIGPGDLSRYSGMDLTTQEGRDLHHKTIEEIISACQDAGKIPGIWTGDANGANHWLSHGCLFVTAGADGVWVEKMARQTLEELDI